MRRRTAIATLAVAGGLMLLSACGGSSGSTAKPTATTGRAERSPTGDIPDTQVYVLYTPASGGYTVSVPEGWARTDLADGAVFADVFNSVRVERAASPDTPTVASVTHDVAPQLVAQGASLEGAVTSVARKSGDAIYVGYTQDSTADPTTGKKVKLAVQRYEFWKDGQQVTITLSGAKGADNVDPWRKVTDSFAWSS